MEAGGYEAMLHDLLAMDLSGFEVRAVPVTEGLQQQQKKLSLDTTQAWWVDCLERGYVFRSKLGLEEHFAAWHERVSTELLHSSYMEFARERRERHPLSRETLGRFLVKIGAKPKRFTDATPGAVGEHMVVEQSARGGQTRVPAVRLQERAPAYAQCCSFRRAAGVGLGVWW
jgi:hypothetical protein